VSRPPEPEIALGAQASRSRSTDAHLAVLSEAVLQALAPRADGIYLDATFGRGGHSAAILQRLGGEGRLLALDRDPAAVAYGLQRFAADPRFSIQQRAFSGMEEVLRARGWWGKVSGVLLDLGVSSPQLDDPRRGFSFLRDGPLDMRMDPCVGPSAADWLAQVSEQELRRVLRDYGEERYAGRIARAVVEARRQAPILRTGQLARLIDAAVPAAGPGRGRGRHPATRSFQALRIEVNRELEELQAGLPPAFECLASGGRLAVISFHSLEDRLVKRFLRDLARGPAIPKGVPVTADRLRPRLRLLGKAVRPGAQEVAANPRARSAVLRAAERL
jgi:16S rRNA (cytosine1402-N4)-methyltransferase